MPVPGGWTWGGGGSGTYGSDAGWRTCGERMWTDGGAGRKGVQGRPWTGSLEGVKKRDNFELSQDMCKGGA